MICWGRYRWAEGAFGQGVGQGAPAAFRLWLKLSETWPVALRTDNADDGGEMGVSCDLLA